MRTPDQLRERIAITWRRQWTEWLGGGGQWPKAFGLGAPTESVARAQWPQFTAWLESWSPVNAIGTVRREVRHWPALGTQLVPTHVEFRTPVELATALGGSTAQQFVIADSRWAECAAAWPDLTDAVRGIADWMWQLSTHDYARFVSVVDWLSTHRNSGLYVRQLPIAGLHSKWVEANTGPISRLLAERFAAPRSTSLSLIAGLATESSRRRIRLLDPALRSQVGGLSDIELGLPELASLRLSARVALVIENHQTALACHDLPGTVLLMGGGFAVTELGDVPWLRDIPLIYWGDLDTAGLAILNALRSHHCHARACLMDETTLLSHRLLWSTEDNPRRADLPLLTAEEARLYEDLLNGRWGVGVRLEQERIHWPTAWSSLKQAIFAA